MASPTFKRLPGFRDFPPEDMEVRTTICEAWRRVSRRYGFCEYDGPPLEGLDLYVEKSGEEIVGQLYNFLDKGGRSVTLRPEMTPSLARILGERSRAMSKPIRWFSVPQLFRYERQQRGRLREHFQWNVDIVGEEGVLADAEILAVAIDGLRELGLGVEDFRARVSDRRLLGALLEALHVPAERLNAAFSVVDKLDRESRDRSLARLESDVGVSPSVARATLDLFEDPELDAIEARFGGRDDVAEGVGRLREYLGALASMGLGEFVAFDLTIVRGLAYYTGLVFELFDRKRELRAICGGGRYDRLLELVGAEPLPAVGFGMGDVVLTELLRDRDLVEPYRRRVDAFIVSIGDDQTDTALRVAHALREKGRSVVFPLRRQAVRKQFAAAGTEGAREVIVLGPEEAARGVAMVRDMESGREREVALDDLLVGNSGS
ncbi:MAG TPA: histidine--tRNA ligase [Longimicrobiales bacterium]